jgi:hypothetical protein
MTSSRLNVLAALLLAGGCSQILGISDYEIDNDLGDTGEGGDTGQGGDGAVSGKGGKAGAGDAGAPPQAGEGPGLGGGDQGGMPGQGGDGMVGGSTGEGGEGGSGLGELVPCDSTSCCNDAGGTVVLTEVLPDGGFELGTYAEGNTPWYESSSNNYAIITDGLAESVTPRSGDYLAFLCGVDDEISTLQSPVLDVPADAGWFELTVFRWFEIDGPLDQTNEDFVSISLFSSPSDEIEELIEYWDQAGDAGDTNTWTRYTASIDAAPHVGKNLYLLFLGQTDLITDNTISGGGSNYMFDDLSLKVGRCYK